MVGGCWFLACFIPSINDAVTILGATTNPIVGFVLPIMFYLKLFPNINIWKKLAAWTTLIGTCIASLSIIVVFFYDKFNH